MSRARCRVKGVGFWGLEVWGSGFRVKGLTEVHDSNEAGVRDVRGHPLAHEGLALG
jgi:hypothetical protein